MTLVSGTMLGPYEIIGLLGSGGMGEVYRARDPKLNRDIALKILPELSASDPDRLVRFKREAQVLASLNHPNIGAIYGFEESSDRQALVLELIDGPTLADRIERGPIPIDEALRIARQIAEALEAARQQGVIHRDLKPANIKLRPDGTVKVLDFGLAKLAQPSASVATTWEASRSPTITRPAATQIGVLMGTAPYMSPEQTRGLAVDNRTDIWAFGCVLYEMLSGRRAFGGQTVSDTIAAILEHEPDWQAIPSSTPARIRDLLRRCLQKDRQSRLHDIADARIEIDDARTVASGSRRVVGLSTVATGLALALMIAAGAGWYAWRSTPSTPHAPVSILIADLGNSTGDPTFDRALEPLLKIVLEGAGFISAYDRTQIARSLGTRPPETLDERAALEFAVKQGIGVVLSGSLAAQGSGYVMSLAVTEAVTGKVIATLNDNAANRDQVLSVATKLATTVRKALGDETTDSGHLFAQETLSATSLSVVREYATAMEALSHSQFDEALRAFSKAVELDPKFGLGWAGMAVAARNLDRQQDAQQYIQEAVRHLDGMTERERYRTRGLAFNWNHDYPACVKEFSDLLDRYSGDVMARNNLAQCLQYLRQLSRAMDEIRLAIKILPKRALFRENLALYAAYNGEFQTAEQEAKAIERPGVFGLLPLAFARLLEGRLPEATKIYEGLAKIDDQGASYTASGLGDIAVYEGRYADAVRIFQAGAATDLSAKDTDRAANKFAALAHTELLREQKAAAIAAGEKALGNSKAVKIRFLVGRIFVEAGDIARARVLAAELGAELQAEPQAYAKIIEAGAALKTGNSRQAIQTLAEANSLFDTWMGHFDLGRAYLAAGAFTQADAEFDRCIKRRGEVLALFLDEEPTYGYLPAAYYYLGRVREGLKTAGFAESYRTYLSIRGRSTEDPLVAEVRQRAGP